MSSMRRGTEQGQRRPMERTGLTFRGSLGLPSCLPKFALEEISVLIIQNAVLRMCSCSIHTQHENGSSRRILAREVPGYLGGHRLLARELFCRA